MHFAPAYRSRVKATVWGWLLGSALCGCVPSAETPSANDSDLPDGARIFAEVVKVRHLPSKGQPPIQFLRRHAYLEAGQRLSEGEHSALDEHASQIGLSGDAKPTLAVDGARLLASDGFYAHGDRTIYILDDPSRRFPVVEEQVLAHESVHALQDQYGLFPPKNARFSDDELLARRALFEGDATLGMMLYEERNWHTSERRIAERVMRGFAEGPISRYVGATNPALMASKPYQQEVLIFPYRAGAAFVGAVLASGGYELLAKVFASPPVSAAQILHPERYARGELPVPIPPPAPPPGYQAGERYVLGELLTRSQLLRCNADSKAVEAAEGWRGDAVVTLRNGQETLTAQQWQMASEQDAAQLASALRNNTRCREAAPGAADTLITERGTRVVALRGAGTQVMSTLATAWLAASLPSPVLVRPLGAIDLAPSIAPPPTPDPYVAGGWLRYPAAGVELPIPDGFTTSHENGAAELELAASKANTVVRLTLGQYFDGATEQLLLTLSRSMAQAVAFSNIVSSGKPYRIATGLGSALAQDFEHEDTIFRGRVVAIPLCGGAGLLAVIQNYGDGGAESAMKRALTGLRQLGGSSYCQRLSPL